MKVLFRILLTFISCVAAFYCVFWVLGALIFELQLWPWISSIASLAVAALVGRYVWTRTVSVQAGLVDSIVLGALTTGGIGFVAGFFGPLILMPGANQGPVLGFITGPFGFLLGAIGGSVHWFARGRRASKMRGSAAG